RLPARPRPLDRGQAGAGLVVRVRTLAGMAGLLSLAAALAAAELVVGVVEGTESPVVSVGETVIDRAPRAVKDWAIDSFGTNDKLVLVLGTLALLGLASVPLGRLALRHRTVAFSLVMALGAVGLVCALTRPDMSAADALPTLVATAAGLAALVVLTGRLTVPPPPGEDPPGEHPALARAGTVARREFVVAALGVGAAAAATGGLGRLLGKRFTAEAARADVLLPAAADPARPLVGTDVAVDGATPFVTPNNGFYRIDTALISPQVTPESWSLRIHGMVEQELKLSYDDLLSRPLVERHITLCCVSNEVGDDLIGNALWLGVPLADVLNQAGVQPGATQLVSRSVDGWTCGTPVAALLDGRDALLAVGMNGEPLPVGHGFPVRMVVPGLYGYVSATKWVTDMELTTWEAFDAYWVRRGWAQQAPVKVQSRIDTPRGRAKLGRGTVALAGVAWATHVGIDRVEIRVDDGDWRSAELAAVPSSDTWRLWRYDWDTSGVSAGSHDLTVRATNSAGVTQPAGYSGPGPDGAEGWHRIGVVVSD
ncbi:MAG TPA: molybdopterin-dependent oxidoreductase, partial [Acidimicrobiales bacterium]